MNAPLLFLILSVSAAPFLTGAIGVLLVRTYNKRSAEKKTTYYKVTFPNEMEPAQVTDWHRSIVAAMPPGNALNRNEHSVALEWWRSKAGFTHVIGVPWTHKELIGQLIGAVRGISVSELDRHPHVEWTVAAEYGISDPTQPLEVARLASQVNATLGAGLYEQLPGDEVLSQLVIAPTGRSMIKEPPVSSASIVDVFFNGFQPSKAELARRQEKISSPTFNAVLRIAVKSDTDVHAKHILKQIARSYERTDTGTVYVRRRQFARTGQVIDRIKRAATPFTIPAVLNSDEVTAFAAWAVTGVKQPGLALGKTQWLPPNELVAMDGIKLGTASASGYDRRVAIRLEDTSRHVLAQGPSGNGKTTFLGGIWQQAVESDFGAAMFDTKGDQFYLGLESIPKDRIDDAIIIDLSDEHASVGLNILHEGDPRGTIDSLINLFIQGTPDPKLFNKVTYNGWHTLRLIPGTTVVDLIPLLDPSTEDEEEWQDWVLRQIPKNSPLQTFWREYKAKRPNDRKNFIAPVLNRLWKFDSYDPLRRFLGQSESTFSLSDAVRDCKIIMVYAPFEIGSEPVSLFLSLMMMEMQRLHHQTRDQKEHPSIMMFDEVQRLRYIPINFADMLSLTRADKVGLVMANQYMSQLAPDMQNAMTNVATMVATRMDGTDARHWQQFMGNAVTPDDLMNLEPYEALGRLAVPGGVSEPVTFKMFAPGTFKPHGHAARVLNRSREQYARPATVIDEEMRLRRKGPSKPVRKRPSFEDEEVGDE